MENHDEPYIEELSPRVRIVRKGTGMAPGHNVEVYEKTGNAWKKHWGTNEMSNDYASTELQHAINGLKEKHAKENYKKQDHMKKGGKVAIHKSVSKKTLW